MTMKPGDIVAYRTSNHIRFGTISEIVERQTKTDQISEWHVERVHTDGGGIAILTDDTDIIPADAPSWDLHAWFRRHPMIEQIRKVEAPQNTAEAMADIDAQVAEDKKSADSESLAAARRLLDEACPL